MTTAMCIVQLARRLAWRRGLIHLACSVCGRDLDWAPAEFAARRPAPLCARCRVLVDEGSLERPAVVLPAGGGRR